MVYTKPSLKAEMEAKITIYADLIKLVYEFERGRAVTWKEKKWAGTGAISFQGYYSQPGQADSTFAGRDSGDCGEHPHGSQL